MSAAATPSAAPAPAPLSADPARSAAPPDVDGTPASTELEAWADLPVDGLPGVRSVLAGRAA